MQDIETTARQVIGRVPRWIRLDLLKDGSEREQAEETLVTMLVNALHEPAAIAGNGPAAVEPQGA